MTKPRPPLAITLGDPSGVGPEITAALVGVLRKNRALTSAVVVGPRSALAAALAAGGFSDLPLAEDLSSLNDPEVLTIRNVGPSGPFPAGTINAAAGAAAVAAVEEAHRLCLTGLCGGMVTGPLGKAAIRLAGSPFSGHTDMLCALTNVAGTRMAMVHRRFRVVMTTLHVSYRAVLEQLTEEAVFKTLMLAYDAWPISRIPSGMGHSQKNPPANIPLLGHGMPCPYGMGVPSAIDMDTRRDAACRVPMDPAVIAVGGLNPHAGEDGLFGDEEARIIVPAIERFRLINPAVQGPIPCDCLFTPARRHAVDVFVAHTHDQGLIAIKTLAPMSCVNVTLGLPYVRTSVGHGTAYDLAGKGLADPGGMLAAWTQARHLLKQKKAGTIESRSCPNEGVLYQ